jgi:hypothetical protein
MPGLLAPEATFPTGRPPPPPPIVEWLGELKLRSFVAAAPSMRWTDSVISTRPP